MECFKSEGYEPYVVVKRGPLLHILFTLLVSSKDYSIVLHYTTGEVSSIPSLLQAHNELPHVVVHLRKTTILLSYHVHVRGQCHPIHH